MKKVLPQSKIKKIYIDTIKNHKISFEALVERASFQACSFIENNFLASDKILTVLGNGLKKVIGLSTSRMLILKGFKVDIVNIPFKNDSNFDNSISNEFFKSYDTFISDEIKHQEDILKSYKIAIYDEKFLKNHCFKLNESDKNLFSENKFGISYDILIDAIGEELPDKFFKNGSLEKESFFMESIEERNKEKCILNYISYINNSSATKISIDIPTGVCLDSGEVKKDMAIKADYTIVLSYINPGILLYPGREYAGKIEVIDDGILANRGIICNGKMIDNSNKAINSSNPFYSNDSFSYNLEFSDIKLKERVSNSFKGTYGNVLFIGGDKGMAGAAYFSSKAAYTMGAGLVKIFTVEENREILQSKIPEAMVVSYDNSIYDKISKDEMSKDNSKISRDNDKKLKDCTKVLKEKLLKEMNWANAIILGPGMNDNKSNEMICKFVLSNTKVPLIIDAGAITIISKNASILKNHTEDIVMTPHLGEMARLIKKDVKYVEKNLINISKEFTKKYNINLVLKSATTIVTTHSQNSYFLTLGNNGMATGGMGDILSGIIGGLIPYEKNIENVLTSGVLIHALAGKIASEKFGKHQMLASDVLSSLKEAF